MTGEPSNAAFISYRREEGGILAMALYQQLTEHRLDAFFDVESIRAGQFDTIILNQIAARPYFLLVLTPGTLERAGDPGDWVRREIEQALMTRRVIVLVHTPNFDFGDLERFLPGDLGQQVGRFNGQELPLKFFKFAVQQLVEEFLIPIQMENLVPPAEEQAVVVRLQQEARSAPAVTEVQLQKYFKYETEPLDEMEDVVDVFYGGRGAVGQQYVVTNRRLLIGPIRTVKAKSVLGAYAPMNSQALWLRHVVDVQPTSNASWFKMASLRIATNTGQVFDLGFVKTPMTMNKDKENNDVRDRAVQVIRAAVEAAKGGPAPA